MTSVLRGSTESPELLAVLREQTTEAWQGGVRLILRSEVLDLPDVLPDRFRDRVRDAAAHIVWVHSLPHLKPSITSLASLRVSGIWLCGDDAEARGATVPAVFGIPMSARLYAALASLSCQWRVLYHGTAEANHKSISTLGLLSTRGQLGFGVYLGTFWKACRFAGRDQHYVPRPDPLVYRVLVNRVPETLFPSTTPCVCALCTGMPFDRACACAHDKVWIKGECGKLQVGRYADGKWITQNEEWVHARDDIVRISEAMRLDRASIRGPHYDPLQRDIRVL